MTDEAPPPADPYDDPFWRAWNGAATGISKEGMAAIKARDKATNARLARKNKPSPKGSFHTKQKRTRHVD